LTTRRLPRSSRGRALPRGASDEITWPPALRGRPPLLCLALLSWLGGGLLATAIATVTVSPNDLAYGLVNTAAAAAGLLLLMAVRPERASRRGRRRPQEQSVLLPGEPVPVRVPVQADAEHVARREPAVH
jgi:peptidoglycan/LPS O-acetylase OafA/YrhL